MDSVDLKMESGKIQYYKRLSCWGGDSVDSVDLKMESGKIQYYKWHSCWGGDSVDFVDLKRETPESIAYRHTKRRDAP